MSDQNDQTTVRAVRVGEEWFVTKVANQPVKGNLDDRSLPTLQQYAAYAANRGYEPLTSIDHISQHVNPREAETGVNFVFRRKVEPSEAELVQALATPTLPAKQPARDPRFKPASWDRMQAEKAAQKQPRDMSADAKAAEQGKLEKNLKNRF